MVIVILPHVPPFVPTQARSGDPGQGRAVSVGPIWHACIAIRPAKHRILPHVKQTKKQNRQLPTSRKDRFFDFNMIYRSKSNFRKLKKK